MKSSAVDGRTYPMTSRVVVRKHLQENRKWQWDSREKRDSPSASEKFTLNSIYGPRTIAKSQ